MLPMELDDYLNHPRLLQKCPPGTGQVYWIRPKLSTSNSNGYIGLNETSLKDRIVEHRKPSNKCVVLRRALLRHGTNNFTIEVLQDMIPLSQLSAAEKKWIAVHDTFHNGYNCNEGGQGGNLLSDPVVKAKHIASHNTEEYKAGQSERSKKAWAKPGAKERRTKNTIEKHAERDFKERHRSGIVKSWIVRKKTGNTGQKKMSATMKAKWKDDDFRSKHVGKKHSEERKNAMKAGQARLTPEERSARVKRAWKTRRANKAKVKKLRSAPFPTTLINHSKQ